MSNIDKKQALLAVIVVVFAATMIASVLAADSAYATKQVISVKNKADQSSSITTGGPTAVTIPISICSLNYIS